MGFKSNVLFICEPSESARRSQIRFEETAGNVIVSQGLAVTEKVNGFFSSERAGSN